MCLQVGRRPLQPLAHPLSSVAARLRLERRRRRHPPTRQLRLSGRRLLLRPLGRRRLHLRPSRRRRRLHLRPSERRRLLLRPLGWRRLQLHLSGQRRLLLLSVRLKYGLRNLRAARRKTSHTACADVAGSTAPAFGAPSALGGAPAFGSTSALGGAPAFGAAPSASAFGTPSQLGGTPAFGTCAFQRTCIPRPGPTTVRVLLFTGGKGVFGGAQGGGAFAAPSGGGGGFASYAPQAASGGFGALAQAGGSAPAPSFGGHR